MVDIEQNRRTRKYSSGEVIRRVLWTLMQPLFWFSPRPCFGWRCFFCCFAAKLGRNVHVYPSAMIYFAWNLEAGAESAIVEHAFPYNLGRVTVAPGLTIGQGQLCGRGR